jgi:mono/diheme cytochrome c family protein
LKAYIPTPNGVDTHNGSFLRYSPDWKGELLADMGGPKAAVRAIMRERVAAARAAAPAPKPVAAAGRGNVPVSGREMFEKTAGGVGCAACHGMNARGGAQFNAPDIRGADEQRLRAALAAVTVMSRITLNDAEIAAVVAHLAELNKQP